jgi:hypothetical protein
VCVFIVRTTVFPRNLFYVAVTRGYGIDILSTVCIGTELRSRQKWLNSFRLRVQSSFGSALGVFSRTAIERAWSEHTIWHLVWSLKTKLMELDLLEILTRVLLVSRTCLAWPSCWIAKIGDDGILAYAFSVVVSNSIFVIRKSTKLKNISLDQALLIAVLENTPNIRFADCYYYMKIAHYFLVWFYVECTWTLSEGNG